MHASSMPQHGISLFFNSAHRPHLLKLDSTGHLLSSHAVLNHLKAACTINNDLSSRDFCSDLDIHTACILPDVMHSLSINSSHLRAELYRLRLLDPTSEVDKHAAVAQDAADHAAELIIFLPLAHDGGELVVSQAGFPESATRFCGGGHDSVKWFAFTSKCELAQVDEVKSGQQLTLHYKLFKVQETSKRKRTVGNSIIPASSLPLCSLFRQIYKDPNFCPETGCILGFPSTNYETDLTISEAAAEAKLHPKAVAVFAKKGFNDAGNMERIDCEHFVGDRDDIPDFSNLRNSCDNLASADSILWCKTGLEWKNKVAGKYYNRFEYVKANAMLVVVPPWEKRRAQHPASKEDYEDIIEDPSCVHCTSKYAYRPIKQRDSLRRLPASGRGSKQLAAILQTSDLDDIDDDDDV